MDDARFDTWTRALARPGSRRRLLRALSGAGAVLAGCPPRAALTPSAHHGMAGPGDPCRTDSQCVAADAPMVCDWNGYGNGLNCCTYEGSNCADDTWCCGTNVCSGGTCTSQSYGCTGEGCACQLYRDPACRASCPLLRPLRSGSRLYRDRRLPRDVCSEPVLRLHRGRCACYQGTYDPDPCDPGLVCCLNADNSGTCLPQYTCTGYGAAGRRLPAVLPARTDAVPGLHLGVLRGLRSLRVTEVRAQQEGPDYSGPSCAIPPVGLK